MSSKINKELVIPYKHVPAKPRNDNATSVVAQSLPMAAMFMRNKILSWSSVFIAVQAWLNEPINAPKSDNDNPQQPALLKITFAIVALLTCYMDVFFPGTNNNLKNSAAAVTSAVADAVSSTVEAAATSA
ncbi:uncharacterized protein SPAPADRAFT_143493 [Spathaspora passalidarum NRRL Y-27907]|uniref:Uncharacterized protein n=1 Tax=Spathaspora passalidarum (strain NRRL Y-27907 / 11-Y1) TaxID=619300 RepID=G3ATX8_SPAPN|nr:uncharacterized protein SPAPADRAFT_143493 [Spathaspora passalidarum NRRL Y-27907]EGW30355.1 hypothetical protein SPAPADRAFT_143493 [Spathaspora passalidarum NRRL Y-27907]